MVLPLTLVGDAAIALNRRSEYQSAGQNR